MRNSGSSSVRWTQFTPSMHSASLSSMSSYPLVPEFATCVVFASLHCCDGDEGLDLLSTQLLAFKQQQQQVDDDAMATARPPLPSLLLLLVNIAYGTTAYMPTSFRVKLVAAAAE